jgi:hypothetical protein
MAGENTKTKKQRIHRIGMLLPPSSQALIDFSPLVMTRPKSVTPFRRMGEVWIWFHGA